MPLFKVWSADRVQKRYVKASSLVELIDNGLLTEILRTDYFYCYVHRRQLLEMPALPKDMRDSRLYSNNTTL